MSAIKKLAAIRAELKVPKNQWNDFSKFKYRNLEDIQEALKPLEQAHNAITVITYDIHQIGDRYYVRAKAELFCLDDGDSVFVTAEARETEERPKFDASQLTGSASSYAGKYALGGMFGLDDSKDADSQEPPKDQNKKQQGKQQNKSKQQPKQQEQTSKEQKFYDSLKTSIDELAGVDLVKIDYDDKKLEAAAKKAKQAIVEKGKKASIASIAQYIFSAIGITEIGNVATV